MSDIGVAREEAARMADQATREITSTSDGLYELQTIVRDLLRVVDGLLESVADLEAVEWGV